MKGNFAGIDVGSLLVKIAVVDSAGEVVFCGSQRTLGRPVEAAKKLLDEIDRFDVSSIIVTGSGAELLQQQIPDRKFEIINEFKSIVCAVKTLYPDVRTIFEMGGQASKFIKINNGQIVEYGISGDCAAGTGSFIDQQADRLHYKVEDVGPLVIQAGRTARVAGRCSVFAKSDMIHAQQKGYTPPEVLKGLCLAVVRNFKATIVKGRHVEPKVLFTGGLALNAGVVAAVREVFELGDQLIVPEHALYLGAIGAALVVRDSVSLRGTAQGAVTKQSSAGDCFAYARNDINSVLHPLSTQNVRFLRDRVKKYNFPAQGKVDAYLGVDIGSVSTNFVVIDKHGDLIMEIYTYTKARPIEVVAKGLKDIEVAIGDKINICGVGTTGSGRELIGELIGADVVKDEITAHKTGALHVCKKLTGGAVDTIFEIGGQDAKYIRIENGIVTDFTMNEACAAGTGSFLEEQAIRLGISIKSEFASLALSSGAPLPLGERCTVFMERDVNSYQLRGAAVKDIVAGLAYSVATNYLNRVVRGRKIGEHIFFQGGTAYNDAVAAAFSQILEKPITVPPHNGVVGAIGSALLARETLPHPNPPLPPKDRRTGTKGREDATKFRGFDVGRTKYTMREFGCNACSNQCDIQEFNVEGAKTYWGDKCSTRFRKKAHTDNVPVIEDLFKLRTNLLSFSEHHRAIAPSHHRTRIGIPRSMFYFDRFPFWRAYFETLGCEVVTSDDTNKTISHDSLELSVSEPCYPIKLTNGHVKNLLDKGIDYIFLPNVISSDRLTTHDSRLTIPYLCPWHQTLPYVVRAVPAFENVKFLIPTIQFELGKDFVKRCLAETAGKLGCSGRQNGAALKSAYAVQAEFNRQMQDAGREAIAALESRGAEGVVLVGRPYNIYDTGANLNVPTKLREHYGLNVIPFDMLPVDEIDIIDVADNMFWNYGRRIIAASKFVARRPYLHMIYITNFKCGPDSFIKHFSTWAAEKPYLTLQFDEHANDAGTVTRIEAYLDSKGLLKSLCKNYKEEHCSSPKWTTAGRECWQQPSERAE